MSVNTFITNNELNEKVKINATGGFDVPVNLFEETVLNPLEIKPETYKNLMEQTNVFNAALVNVAGVQATDYMKENAGVESVALKYDQGSWAHTTIFTRPQGDVEGTVVTEISNLNPLLQEAQQEVLELFKTLDN